MTIFCSAEALLASAVNMTHAATASEFLIIVLSPRLVRKGASAPAFHVVSPSILAVRISDCNTPAKGSTQGPGSAHDTLVTSTVTPSSMAMALT
jgi:hypothetical protein